MGLFCARFPCPGRDAAFFTLLRRTGTVPNAGVRDGPGSAAHQAAKSGPLRCVRGTKVVVSGLEQARLLIEIAPATGPFPMNAQTSPAAARQIYWPSVITV